MTTNFNNAPNDRALSRIYHNKQPRPDKHVVFYGTHDGAQGDPRKWEMPGWRIEQTFSKNTLIGNWCEERNRVEHNNYLNDSTNRQDYKDDVKGNTPSTQLRRHALRRNDGSTDKYQTANGYRTKDTSYISWYDGDYRRTQDKALRKWNRHKLVWEPEWSDHPVQGKPTQLGIRQSKFKHWADDTQMLTNSVKFKPTTTYNGDFEGHEKSAFPLRYAQSPKHLSSKMNAISRTNKSLRFRGMPLLCPPERQPTV